MVEDLDFLRARTVLERHCGKAQDLRAIVGQGSVNRIVAARVGHDRFVVRMCDRLRGEREYPKEAWCLGQAAAAGIPSPSVVGMGTVDDTSYMIQRFVDGVNGKLYQGDTLQLWRILGKYARLVHGMPARGFGNCFDTSRGEFVNSHTKTWAAFIDYNIANLTPDDRFIALGVYAPASSRQINDVFETLKEIPIRIGVNHGDLALRNLLVSDTGGATLIDWGCAFAGAVPHADFSTMLTWYSHTPEALSVFFDGYGLAPAEVKSLMPELQRFRLIQSFDTLRWAIDHLDDPSLYVDRARACCEVVCPLTE